MLYFIDFEFIEDGFTIDPISIGIVAEDGRTYYAINRDCNLSKASDWVKENVLSQLPTKDVNTSDPSISPRVKSESLLWKSKTLIRAEVAEFLGAEEFCYPIEYKGWNKFLHSLYSKIPLSLHEVLKEIPVLQPRTYFKTKYKLNPNNPKPEIWGYYADYDWIAFCQLFGSMMDLPLGFPMYARDLKQWCDMLGNPLLPEQKSGQHNALEDAKYNKCIWDFLSQLTATQSVE